MVLAGLSLIVTGLWFVVYRKDDSALLLLNVIIYHSFTLESQPPFTPNTAHKIVKNLQLYWPSVQRMRMMIKHFPFWHLITVGCQFSILNITLQNSFWLYAIDYCLLDGVLAEILFPLKVNCEVDFTWTDKVTKASCTIPSNKFYQSIISL